MIASQTVEDEEALRNLYNENSGVLDEPGDDEVDLTSEAFEIWSQATRENPDLRKAVEALPDVVLSTKAHLFSHFLRDLLLERAQVRPLQTHDIPHVRELAHA